MADGNGNGNGKTADTIRWVVGLILVALVSYYTSKSTTEARLSVAETKIERMGQDLSEIKDDIRKILQLVR
jgi:hypothetical protein